MSVPSKQKISITMDAKKYPIREIAKFNSISVWGSLQELAGIRISAETILDYYRAMMKDLETGAMERSCKEFDRIVSIDAN